MCICFADSSVSAAGVYQYNRETYLVFRLVSGGCSMWSTVYSRATALSSKHLRFL